MVWADMARRKKQFHPNEDWCSVKLWGLFTWGLVSRLIKSGELISDYTRRNRTVWVYPSPEAYHKHIEPLLTKSIEELTFLSGW